MITSIIRTILGLGFVLFIPGFLLSHLFFKRLAAAERIGLSLGLSIVVVVFLGFFLTMIGSLPDITGITGTTVWLSLILSSIIFIVLRGGAPRTREVMP